MCAGVPGVDQTGLMWATATPIATADTTTRAIIRIMDMSQVWLLFRV